MPAYKVVVLLWLWLWLWLWLLAAAGISAVGSLWAVRSCPAAEQPVRRSLGKAAGWEQGSSVGEGPTSLKVLSHEMDLAFDDMYG